MKLVDSRQSTSFYETFSDLIFCTLCLFILIVAGLALRLQQSSKSLDEKIQNLVSPNRFQGGSASSYMYTSLVRMPRKGADGRETWGEYVVWSPVNQKDDIETNGAKDRGKEAALKDHTQGHVLILPLADATKISSGIGKRLNHVTWSGYTECVQRYYVAKSKMSARVQTLANKSDYAAMSKLVYRDTSVNRWMRSWNWSTVSTRCVKSVLTPMRNESPEGAFVRFTLIVGDAVPPDDPAKKREFYRTQRVFKVGKLEMTVNQFDALLRSILPGKGFFVEYLDGDGKATEPPEWVMSVLKETGYDGRMLGSGAG